MSINQSFLDDDGQFPQPGFVDDGVLVDPMLDSITSAGVAPESLTALAADPFLLSSPIWNPNLGAQAQSSNEMRPADVGRTTRGDSRAQRQPSDPSTASSTLAHTRSSSSTPDQTARKRSMASSRSSIPSAPPDSPEHNHKGRKLRQQPARQQHPRQRKQTEKMAQTSSSPKTITRVKQEPDVVEGDSKRNRFLERNRVAASKCRQKKKEWINDLEETKHDLENQNSALQKQHSELLLELTQIKNQLMSHATCNDPNIDQWIELEARKFVQSAAGRYDFMLPLGGASSGMHRARNDPVVQHSRNNSVGTHLPSPKSRDGEINFDHMPDDMFDDRSV